MFEGDADPMDYPIITFGEIRKFCSVIDRISVCMLETMTYENFESIRDVPHTYDDRYLYGFGGIKSEFQVEGRLKWMPCMELMLSEKPREEENI